MKATKKIVGATAALVAAVALSAGSTFAWFASNGTATVENFNVNVAVSNNLVISTTSNGTFTSSVNLAEEEANTDFNFTTMQPSSTAGGTTAAPVFYIMNSADNTMESDDSDAKNSTFTQVSDNPEASPAYFVDTVYLKYLGEEGDQSASGKKIQATVTATSEADIAKAVRVLIYDATTDKSYIFAPNHASGDEITAISSLDSDSTINEIATTATEPSSPNVSFAEGVSVYKGTTANDVNSGINFNTELELQIYVYYEGQDPYCTTANGLNAANVPVSIVFSVADAS